MKRTYSLVHPKIKPARLIDAARHDIKKFLKKERNKPTGRHVPFWDFEVKFGQSEQETEIIALSEINQYMDKAEADGQSQFYVEITTISGVKVIKEENELDDDFEPSSFEE